MRVQRAIVCAHQHAQTRPSERRWLGFAFADGNARASECVHIYLCCTQISCSARSRKDGRLSSPRDWLTEPTPTRPRQDKQTSDLIANAVMSAPYLQSQQQPELDKRRNSQLTHKSNVLDDWSAISARSAHQRLSLGKTEASSHTSPPAYPAHKCLPFAFASL